MECYYPTVCSGKPRLSECAGCPTPLPAPRHFIAGHAVCGDCFANLPGGVLT